MCVTTTQHGQAGTTAPQHGRPLARRPQPQKNTMRRGCEGLNKPQNVQFTRNPESLTYRHPAHARTDTNSQACIGIPARRWPCTECCPCLRARPHSILSIPFVVFVGSIGRVLGCGVRQNLLVRVFVVVCGGTGSFTFLSLVHMGTSLPVRSTTCVALSDTQRGGGGACGVRLPPPQHLMYVNVMQPRPPLLCMPRHMRARPVAGVNSACTQAT